MYTNKKLDNETNNYEEIEEGPFVFGECCKKWAWEDDDTNKSSIPNYDQQRQLDHDGIVSHRVPANGSVQDFKYGFVGNPEHKSFWDQGNELSFKWLAANNRYVGIGAIVVIWPYDGHIIKRIQISNITQSLTSDGGYITYEHPQAEPNCTEDVCTLGFDNDFLAEACLRPDARDTDLYTYASAEGTKDKRQSYGYGVELHDTQENYQGWFYHEWGTLSGESGERSHLGFGKDKDDGSKRVCQKFKHKGNNFIADGFGLHVNWNNSLPMVPISIVTTKSIFIREPWDHGRTESKWACTNGEDYYKQGVDCINGQTIKSNVDGSRLTPREELVYDGVTDNYKINVWKDRIWNENHKFLVVGGTKKSLYGVVSENVNSEETVAASKFDKKITGDNRELSSDFFRNELPVVLALFFAYNGGDAWWFNTADAKDHLDVYDNFKSYFQLKVLFEEEGFGIDSKHKEDGTQGDFVVDNDQKYAQIIDPVTKPLNTDTNNYGDRQPVKVRFGSSVLDKCIKQVERENWKLEDPSNKENQGQIVREAKTDVLDYPIFMKESTIIETTVNANIDFYITWYEPEFKMSFAPQTENNGNFTIDGYVRKDDFTTDYNSIISKLQDQTPNMDNGSIKTCTAKDYYRKATISPLFDDSNFFLF